MRARWDSEATTAAEYLRLVREHGPAYTPADLSVIEDLKREDQAPSDKWTRG